jgi:hypothetical protein
MKSLDLIKQAAPTPSQELRLLEELHLSRWVFHNAKKRGRLSPTIAGQIASRLGQDPTRWIAVAALEAEPDTPAKPHLLTKVVRVAKS